MPAKPSARSLLGEMKQLGDSAVAAHAQGFFKTGKGEYGEGDKFIGIRMPVIRQQAKRLREHSLEEITEILHSPWHEIRMIAILGLVEQYNRCDETRSNEQLKRAITQCYLGNIDWINNWDLVDCSAHKIIGPHFENRRRKPLEHMARSQNLWKRRIAIMATFHFIRFSGKKDVSTTLTLARILLGDKEDLIHKATGWMLREAGKFDPDATEGFLKQYYHQMPRTMLRYAIEKHPEKIRQAYLKDLF